MPFAGVKHDADTLGDSVCDLPSFPVQNCSLIFYSLIDFPFSFLFDLCLWPSEMAQLKERQRTTDAHDVDNEANKSIQATPEGAPD
jgi:hypothetical protein